MYVYVCVYTYICCCCLVTEPCPTLLRHHCSPAGSSAHGVSQARILECVTISFSRGSSPPPKGTRVSCLEDRRFFTTEPPGKLICIQNTYILYTYVYIHKYIMHIHMYLFLSSFLFPGFPLPVFPLPLPIPPRPSKFITGLNFRL